MLIKSKSVPISEGYHSGWPLKPSKPQQLLSISVGFKFSV